MGEEEYGNVPYDDLEHLKIVMGKYESGESKNIAHGLQKDAIQNALGAILKSDKNSFENWKVTFELREINGKNALVFWDEGTTGLIGKICSRDEYIDMNNAGKLTDKERLGRFYYMYRAGGGSGPGSFGQGKLIFQGSSKDLHFYCDSLRIDGEYVAMERFMDGSEAKQTFTPKSGEVARDWIKDKTGMDSLETPGTKITVLNLEDEIAESFKKSFEDELPNRYSDIFAKMIEETWWEILQMGAKIFIKWSDKEKQIKLDWPLSKIREIKDKEDGWRVYRKKHLKLVIGADEYKISELALFVAPELVDEDLRAIWAQRKKMKIGPIPKLLRPNQKIARKFFGYTILDPKLERLIEEEKLEGDTHYDFKYGKGEIRAIGKEVKRHLEIFETSYLKLDPYDEGGASVKSLKDAISEVNKHAPELGLPTDFFSGPKFKDIEILINEFSLPHTGSKIIEPGDLIGPLKYDVINKTDEKKSLELQLTATQGGEDPKRKDIENIAIELDTKEEKTVEIGEFALEKDEFRLEGWVAVTANAIDKTSDENKHYRATRRVWFGIDEPPEEENPIKLISESPTYPRAKTKRVEIEDWISNFSFKISNTGAKDVRLNLRLAVRKDAGESTSEILVLIDENNVQVSSMKDYKFFSEGFQITEEKFGEIDRGPRNAQDRKCSILLTVKATEPVLEYRLRRKEKIASRKFVFYVGIDPPGSSIFADEKVAENEKDDRRSWIEPLDPEGYCFVINSKHTAYEYAHEHGIENWYFREQALTQAFALAVKEENYKGALSDFKNDLTSDELTPDQAFLTIDKIIGMGLKKLGGI